jgi:hypothetical protein
MPLPDRSSRPSGGELGSSRECEFIEPQGKSEDAISPHPKILADARLVHG